MSSANLNKMLLFPTPEKIKHLKIKIEKMFCKTVNFKLSNYFCY